MNLQPDSIKIESKTTKQETQFPTLRQSKHNKDVWMFTDRSSGICLSSDSRERVGQTWEAHLVDEDDEYTWEVVPPSKVTFTTF